MKKSFVMVLMLVTMAWAAPSLGQVGRFDNRAIGYAGGESPNYEAFRTELAKGASARPEFERLVKEGSPAARIYSAIGLYSLDKAAGTKALEGLKADSSPLKTMNGCLMNDTTVGKTAQGLLANGGEEIQFYLPR